MHAQSIRRFLLTFAVLPSLALAAGLEDWHPGKLYRDGLSAREIIGAPVLGEGGEEIGEVKDILVSGPGSLRKLVVEVGGFRDLGDQHIGVPWSEVKIGKGMAYVQVPLKEVEDGTYSLFGEAPQGEHVKAAAGEWRVNELLGDFADLEDVRRYGLVIDVIFDAHARAQGVVVLHAPSGGRRAATLAFPYAPFRDEGGAYRLPYRNAEAQRLERFDYGRLGELSRYAGRGGS